MKSICGFFVLIMVLFAACASAPYNPSKPEMSVPGDQSYKIPPRTFNQFHRDWNY